MEMNGICIKAFFKGNLFNVEIVGSCFVESRDLLG